MVRDDVGQTHSTPQIGLPVQFAEKSGAAEMKEYEQNNWIYVNILCGN